MLFAYIFVIITIGMKKKKRSHINRKDTGGKAIPSCDWQGTARGGMAESAPLRKGHSCTPRGRAGESVPARSQRTRLHRFDGGFGWSGVRTEAYKESDGSWAHVIRRTLVGNRGEGTDFHLRYFEVAPGGHTTLERHEHEHVVVALRGSGLCRVKGRDYELGFMDVLYIPPSAPHKLSNPGNEPFGFFCVVDAERDRPVGLDG